MEHEFIINSHELSTEFPNYVSALFFRLAGSSAVHSLGASPVLLPELWLW